jgi:hypothetical protein
MSEDDAATKAENAEEEHDEAKEEMEKLEEGDPPENLEDWPDGKAKYETFGGPEGPHTYQEGPEEKLGPSGVRHHEDGSVTVDGEKVDNPEDFKGEPIPGGPTDPNSPDVAGEKDENKQDDDGGSDDESD